MQTPSPEAMARLEMSDADLARFMSKIDTTGPCWRWTGGHNGLGYGQFHKRSSDGRRQRYAHRFAYELFVGPIPEGMTIDHACDRGREGCLTPSHLRLMPMVDNVRRSESNILMRKSRQTHCKHGHPLSGDNLYVTPDGRRQCHICRARWRAQRDPEALREYARRYARELRTGQRAPRR